MSMADSKAETYVKSHADRFEEDLCELLRIPSVSADSRYQQDVQRAAQWLGDRFRDMSLKTQLVKTNGHPIVFAATEHDENLPTVLVYGHYDVQPPDPLDEWKTPPFEPSRRNGNVYARGATDDKGQVLTHVFSAEALLKCGEKLPVNLKFLIEGEEEVGSPNLEHFINSQRELLSCDIVVISDTSQFGPGQPAITYGLRGITYFELRLQGPKQDLHSGVFGGAVANPANTIAKLMAALIDEQGRIQIPGFYDDVTPITSREKSELARLPFDDGDFARQIGVAGLQGEAGFSTLERRWARPTFDVNGLTSGYQGEGAKTVLPATASAKFSFRLVPKQDPKQIQRSLREFLQARLPSGISMELTSHHGAPGIVVPLDSPFMQAAARAITKGFGKEPVYIREGGSIPVVMTFREALGADTLLLGWGLNDDNPHSPNEKFCLADFHRGILSSLYLWRELAALTPAPQQ